MHDGGVVISHLTGISEPPTVAPAVVRPVGVATVITLRQSGRDTHPLILEELGRAGILN